MDEICNRYDLVMMPTTLGAAFRLGEFDGASEQLYDSDRFTTLANLTGCPAISLPVLRNGLSYGVTLMSRRFGEETLYKAAFMLENEWRGGNE